MSTTETEAHQRRLRLTVEYDGTDFAGFQLQAKERRTVQFVLESAIEQLSGEFCRVYGAGRTDAGVHATGQVVHFDTTWSVPADKMALALNRGALPRDLIVRGGLEVDSGFHARYSATARIYRYTVLNRPLPSAILGRYAWHVREPLDIAAMRAAAVELTGAHDYAAFGLPHARGRSTVRRIERVSVRAEKDCVRITVRGNAFLKHMVRAFVGTLVWTGLGRLTPDAVRALRESRNRRLCANIAPPHGLCLVRVEYDGNTERFDTNQE